MCRPTCLRDFGHLRGEACHSPKLRTWFVCHWPDWELEERLAGSCPQTFRGSPTTFGWFGPVTPQRSRGTETFSERNPEGRSLLHSSVGETLQVSIVCRFSGGMTTRSGPSVGTVSRGPYFCGKVFRRYVWSGVREMIRSILDTNEGKG